MSVAYVNHATVNDLDGNTTVLLPVPSGLAAGDLWLVLIQYDTDASGADDFATPSGWNPVSAVFMPAVNYPVARGFWKTAGGSESATTFTLVPNGTIYRVFGTSLRLAGHDPANPIDIASAAQSADQPNVSVSRDGSLAICFFIEGDNTATVDSDKPTGTTFIVGAPEGYAASGAAYQAVDAGTYSPGAWGLPSNPATQTIIIQPAAAGGERTFQLDAFLKDAFIAGTP